jgi:glycosyltransferase involved in cell wall biosynthesis
VSSGGKGVSGAVQLTIGLPVYNGADLLARSLDHLLAQSYGDFELIVSDNASTDATADICAEYVKRDPRIHYFRQEKNLVWTENFRFTLTQAKTPYFMWVTHDDIWLPRFAEANIATLEANPDAVCSVSKILYFTTDGARKIAPDTGALCGTPTERIKSFLLQLDNCGRFYGVYRTEALKASFPPDLRIYGADWLVVALTLLHGDHLEVDEVLLEREAQPEGHYLRGLGRTDRFKPGWFDRLFPLHNFNTELRQKLPRQVMKDIGPALSYLNLRQFVAMQELCLPMLKGVIGPARNLAADIFHRRWRSKATR